jgi:hypothetical protein
MDTLCMDTRVWIRVYGYALYGYACMEPLTHLLLALVHVLAHCVGEYAHSVCILQQQQGIQHTFYNR